LLTACARIRACLNLRASFKFVAKALLGSLRVSVVYFSGRIPAVVTFPEEQFL
jgi:hypothetical protein